MAKVEKVKDEVKVFDLNLKFDGSKTATLYRKGLPMIIDTVGALVLSLFNDGKKPGIDFGVSGDNPECWPIEWEDGYVPPVLSETVEGAAVVEAVA
jgi:hypothetical protein